MPTREIPRDKWVQYFEGFTTDHDSWLVSLHIKDKDADHKAGDTEARKLPLREISADVKDKEHTIVITVGTSGDEMMRHEIEAVSHVHITQTEDGIDSALLIEGRDGQATTLKLSMPASV
jgi:Family of unknown function (DUF5335)